MSRHRRTLSTHLIRLTARAASRHYMRLQAAAREDRKKWAPIAALGIGLTDAIRVEKATHQRGKWVVVAIPQSGPKPAGRT